MKQIKNDYPKVEIIAGGTPSFSTHLLEKDRVCSPELVFFGMPVMKRYFQNNHSKLQLLFSQELFQNQQKELSQ